MPGTSVVNADLFKPLVVLAAFFCSTTALAGFPDYEREKRLAQEITDAIVIGDPVHLKTSDHDFLGIYTEAETEKPEGAVLILHGRGFHPAWPEVIQPLRTALPEKGWATLSIQMPVLKKTAKYYDYVPIFSFSHERIKAGIRQLKEEGYQKIVVLAHSCGTHMAMDYVRHHGDQSFHAYIGVSMGATDYKQPMKKPYPLDQMDKPVLDVYGEHDYPAVIRLAPERATMIRKAGHTKSKQIVIDKAEHFYNKQEHVDLLILKVTDWLNNL